MDYMEVISTTMDSEVSTLNELAPQKHVKTFDFQTATSSDFDETDREVASISQLESNDEHDRAHNARTTPQVSSDGATRENTIIKAKKKSVEAVAARLQANRASTLPRTVAGDHEFVWQQVGTSKDDQQRPRDDSEPREPDVSFTDSQSVGKKRNRKMEPITVRRKGNTYTAESKSTKLTSNRPSSPIVHSTGNDSRHSPDDTVCLPKQPKAYSSLDNPLSQSETNTVRDQISSDRRADELVLIAAGKYCCHVSREFLHVQWQNFATRRGRSSANYEDPFHCKRCRDTFKISMAMVDHVWVKHEKKRFFCPHCISNPFEFTSRNNIVPHVKQDHSDMGDGDLFSQEAVRRYGQIHRQEKIIWLQRGRKRN